MILVDYRESKEGKGEPGLYEDLKKTSLPLQLDRLDGGDLCFLGRGPNNTEVMVGVEFKKWKDLFSSIRTKRLQGHQLHELQPYDFKFLLLEGVWVANDAGQVCMRSGYRDWKPVAGNMRVAELEKTLLGLTLRAGVIVKEVAERRDTIRWIQSLYRNFTDVAWDDHTSHLGVYRPQGLTKPSPFCNFISGIPGVGLKRAKAVEAYFTGSPRRAVAARADEWAEVEGIGKKGAQTIDRFLEGQE